MSALGRTLLFTVAALLSPSALPPYYNVQLQCTDAKSNEMLRELLCLASKCVLLVKGTCNQKGMVLLFYYLFIDAVSPYDGLLQEWI